MRILSADRCAFWLLNNNNKQNFDPPSPSQIRPCPYVAGGHYVHPPAGGLSVYLSLVQRGNHGDTTSHQNFSSEQQDFYVYLAQNWIIFFSL